MGLLDEAIREHLDLKRRRGADPSEIDRLEREALGPVRRAPHDGPDSLADAQSTVAGEYPADEDVAYGLEDAPEWADAEPEPATFEHDLEPAAEASPSGYWDETEPATQIAPAPESGVEPEAPERPYVPRHHEIAEEWESHGRQGMPAEPAGVEPDEPAPAPPAPPSSEEPDGPPSRDSPEPVFGGERHRPAAPDGYDLEQETMEHDVEAEELSQADRPEPEEGEDMLEETPDFLQDTPDHDRLWFEQRPPRDFDFDG